MIAGFTCSGLCFLTMLSVWHVVHVQLKQVSKFSTKCNRTALHLSQSIFICCMNHLPLQIPILLYTHNFLTPPILRRPRLLGSYQWPVTLITLLETERYRSKGSCEKIISTIARHKGLNSALVSLAVE